MSVLLFLTNFFFSLFCFFLITVNIYIPALSHSIRPLPDSCGTLILTVLFFLNLLYTVIFLLFIMQLYHKHFLWNQ